MVSRWAELLTRSGAGRCFGADHVESVPVRTGLAVGKGLSETAQQAWRVHSVDRADIRGMDDVAEHPLQTWAHLVDDIGRRR